MKKTFLLLLGIALCLQVSAQNIQYAKHIIFSLASPEMHGRGYFWNGDKDAANFLSKQMEFLHLQKFGNSYYQHFNIDCNGFPNKMEFSIDGNQMNPGEDFMMHGISSGVKGEYKTVRIDANLLTKKKKLNKLLKSDLSDKILIVDSTGIKTKDEADFFNGVIYGNILKAKGIIEITDKNLSYSPLPFRRDHPIIILKRASLPAKVKKVKLNVDNNLLENYQTQNVMGYIPGEVDSFVVFTAHYDHVGVMGKHTYFPGAHDNASGCAMTLDLARHFAENKPHYTMVFILFSGEEIGLMGSKYFAENPLFELSKIKFLTNLDLLGSGEEGIMMVNATENMVAYEKFQEINSEEKLLKKVGKRGPAQNSDHYYFHEKGVPAVFIYTLGAYKEYHNIYDKSEGLPLNAYAEIFKLLVSFTAQIQNL